MSVSYSLSSPPVSSRPLSRPSSRGSLRSARASSPSVSLDDPGQSTLSSFYGPTQSRQQVAIRTHMSTLKHSIRQQQAQLHTLENIVLRGPRPLPPGMLSSPPRSPDLPDFNIPPPPLPSQYTPTPNSKLQKRSSFDILHSMAPESSLPLPKRDVLSSPPAKQDGGMIPEGIPVDFGVGSTSPNAYKRISSPTRTLSRTSFFSPFHRFAC
jgi:hypothetical protein